MLGGKRERHGAPSAPAPRGGRAGPFGAGNPESSAGSWIAGCLFALGVGLAAALRGQRAVAPIERLLVVTGTLFFAHMAFVFARPLMVGIAIGGSEGGGYVLAFLVMVALAVWPIAAVRARITTDVAPAWMLAVGAAAGVLAAFADSRVYWYELRNETWTATRFLSLLELGIAFMVTVIASNGPAEAEERS